MKRLLLSFFALAVPVLLSGCGQSPDEVERTLWETAMYELSTFQFEAARQTFVEIAEERPDEPIGLYAEAAIAEHQMLFWNAMPEYMILVDQQATFEPARYGLWRTLDWNGYTEDAIQSASQWLAAFPSSQLAALSLVQSLLAGQRYERAATLLDSAVVLGLDESVASMIRACSHRARNNFDSAAVFAAQSTPVETAEWYRWAADYMEADHQYDSALVLSHAAWELADGDWEHWWRHFRRMLRLDDRHGVRRMIAELEAVETPPYMVAWVRMEYYTAIGEYNKAKREGVMYIREFEQDLSTLFTDLKYSVNAGDVLSADGNVSVIQGFMEARDLPQQFEDLMDFSLLHAMRDVRIGIEYLAILRGTADKYRNQQGLVITELKSLYGSGQLEEFEELTAELLEEHGDDPSWLVGIGDVLAQTNVQQYDRAYEVYLDALSADRWHYPAIEHNVDLLLWRERPQEAARLFELYPHLADTLPQAAMLLARVKIHNDQVDEAYRIVEAQAEPIRMVIDNYLALDSALRLTHHHEARPQLAELIASVASDIADAVALAAEIAVESRQWDRAIELADRALALDETMISPAVTKAWATFNKGEKADAFEMFVNNSVAERNDTRNNMYYSRALALEGREADRAGNLARMAVFESQGRLDTRLNLAFVYYQIGRYDLSYGEAFKAARLAPKSPQAWFRAGMAQYERGNSEGIDHLRKAINLGLDGEELATARRILGG